ncbi:MAG: TIGR01244 family sulfur transferase [Pseudomonadota bacterium]|nr:TIGR01244 family sulfur transferase [Pseudomonadota bacterium]
MSQHVGFAGQLLPNQMSEVAEKGFRSVINNRPDLEGGADQPTSAQIEDAARAAGLHYVFQPIVPNQVTQFDIEVFARHYNELPKPILMFCRTGNRSSGLYQMAKQMDLIND